MKKLLGITFFLLKLTEVAKEIEQDDEACYRNWKNQLF